MRRPRPIWGGRAAMVGAMTDNRPGGKWLRACVHTLAGDIGERNVFRPRALAQAASFIAGEWRAQGYDVASQVYDVGSLPCANVEIERRGTHCPGHIVLVGAHYDSVPGSPGADDDASGVAALLALSQRFAAAAPRSTVRFVAFVNEEPPFFRTDAMGSAVYAARARMRGEDIRVMLSLEAIGYHTDAPGSQHYPPFFRLCYPDRGDFVAFVSNLDSRRVLRRAVALFRAQSDFPVESLAAPSIVPGVSWSDHRSFWRQGYHALMVTDTALYRYPHYHTPDDTPDKLDYDSLGRIVEGLAAAVAGLAEGR
jgi:Zn-dependent M28 family amino/carboxypeptidase